MRSGGLAVEQAALRRVATLVARGASPQEVFGAVTEEIGQLLGVDYAHLGRYEPDRMLAIVGSWGDAAEPFPVGSERILGAKNLSTIVFETGRPARIHTFADASGPLAVALHERGVRSGVGTPIIVDGRLWGVIGVSTSRAEPLPADTDPGPPGGGGL